ncbi:MAG: hydrogenase formation protein HypD [Candidatus Omnitrophica bacterium]|nr:hydrogenase formation protein HypD [Candidatus Omnitrophota bacterium]
MKFVDEFRRKDLILSAAKKIRELAPKENLNIMEVCGTHTQSFFRFGLRSLLPDTVRLIAGPGCPVCVSSQQYIDSAISLCSNKDVIISTFGDMLRVPGSTMSLEQSRSCGAEIRVVYSPFDALKIAQGNPEKKIVFLGVGFETTAPTIALSVLAAKKMKIKNISFLVSLKLIPPAMRTLLEDERLNISGFLCPGHVSAVIGTRPYAFIARKYKIPCCVAGFEPLDIIEGIYLIIRQIVTKKPGVLNQYARVVTESGNKRAQRIMSKVFVVRDALWRGLGVIPKSGLFLRKEFSQLDAQRLFALPATSERPTTNDQRLTTKCRCGDVLRGIISPPDCPLFAKICTPENPVGPCMVSYEGACSAYYKYQK